MKSGVRDIGILKAVRQAHVVLARNDQVCNFLPGARRRKYDQSLRLHLSDIRRPSWTAPRTSPLFRTPLHLS